MYKTLLCLRYLRTRWIAMASIISVTLGVATMIVVNSVMAGFATEMRDRIHGILADIILETHSLNGDDQAAAHMALARDVAGDSIEAMTATVEVYGMISFDYNGHSITRPVTLIGIEPEGKARVGPLVDHLESYNEQKDGDLVIRPPLRSRDEVPGWDLTDDAQQRRWLRVEYERTEIERFESESREDTLLPDFDPIPSSDPGDPGPPADLGDPVPPPSTPPTGPAPDLDRIGPPSSGLVEAADPAAPLSGRVYIGTGLIEFPYEDKQTGKIRMMRMVRPGDDVKLTTVSAGRPPEPRHFSATVVDTFKSGMSEYDSNLVFVNIDELQRVRGMIDPSTGNRAITSIQIKLKPGANVDDVVDRLRAAFPYQVYSVRTWEQKQGPLLAAVEIETAILNVLLFLIIAVAGFGILAIFYMIVVEKTRDIGILKALGASSGGVMSIFLGYGLALGLVGSGVGVGLGLLFVHYINEIEKGITWVLGRKVFDETIYYFPAIPTAVQPGMVFWVANGAVVIAVLASILPARRAARLHPVDALRYE